MKALTTMLVDRAMAKQETPADGLKEIRDLAQAKVSAPLVDACSFSRPTSYAGNLAARQFGMVGRYALKKSREARAGGLPQHFVLAVTADDVVVLEETFGGGRTPTRILGQEIARWPRTGLGVDSKVAGYLTNLTLSTPGPEGAVECCVTKSPLTDSFVALLSDPARQTPAVSA